MQQNARSRKIIIFGNSSSGKSTLAKALADALDALHLDLDTVAWRPDAATPVRREIADSVTDINKQLVAASGWVVEGCYADLLERIVELATEIVYLNLPVEECLQNAKSRPWEAHKYASKAEQDANLPMLLDWIADYEQRNDTFSAVAHQRLFEQFDGEKTELTTRAEALEFA